MRLDTKIKGRSHGLKRKVNFFSQKLLYRERHSGLDPESSVFKLDSRFRGNDNPHYHCK